MSEARSFSERVYLGVLESVYPFPSLIGVQRDSYRKFLQMDELPDKRSPSEGLENVFRSVFPIESSNKNVVVEYHGYSFDEPKYSEDEAKENDVTYSAMLKALIRMIYIETGEVREKEVYIGAIPLMTKQGTFIINGSERVVVSQIHKSPGVVFNVSEDKSVFAAKVIPEKGLWLEFEIDANKELLYVKIDRKKGVLVTSFLSVLGSFTKKELIQTFYKLEEVDLTKRQIKQLMESGKVEICLAEDILEPHTQEVIFEAGQELISQDIGKILSFDIKKIKIIEPSCIKKSRIILNCLNSDHLVTEEESVSFIHSIIRHNEVGISENAKSEFRKMFFDPKKYHLGIVGRYKLNKKLYDEDGSNESVLSLEDIIRVIRYLLDVHTGDEPADDIDHLGNRRVRCVGELFSNQLKVGFARMERMVKERLSVENIDEITPQKLINTKPITSVIKEFFGTSQLSQFMDETNPLASLTHKRRLNALGPGGLSRERASFEVRDVHYTHYGRVCPIETPEGPSIGLILSLCTYTKVNEHGFLVAPYRKVVNKKLTDDIQYITPIEEDRCYIAQVNTPVDKTGKISAPLVIARNRGEFVLVPSEKINYMDVSAKQSISVSTALIPFLEHDDANRALMGSNMQRQAVPLVLADSPIVGTGMEAEVAKYSGVSVLADRPGKVVKVSSTEIQIQSNQKDNKSLDVYQLKKHSRTNQNTCFNQRPIVKKGARIKKGQVIADGPACDRGELALGQNVSVAFMCWEGYNFEDAIIINERLIKDDMFTSIHIEEYQIDARETKLGSEKFTKDLPYLSEESFHNLDEDGIIRVGAKVKAGDVLVGRITPKGGVESTPEYKLLHSIFGEKAREIKDTSLRLPHVAKGTVVKVVVFDRKKGDELPVGVEMLAKVYVAQKRKIQEGDKVAGRHGNKGVVSRIVPEEDMPYFENGQSVDIILNPLGVPSRMNLGQILETQLGWAGHTLGQKLAIPVFEGNGLKILQKKLQEAGLPEDGKVTLYDGKTGEAFQKKITVGYIYMLKLAHMVDDKMHSRSTGPYSLVTQQPLGGKAQFGGQRLGEMEVWALQAYGAAYTLQEFLTVKADDMVGRAKIYEDIVKGNTVLSPGVPESFNVLLRELRGLGLDLSIYDKDGNILCLTDKDLENLNKVMNKQS